MLIGSSSSELAIPTEEINAGLLNLFAFTSSLFGSRCFLQGTNEALGQREMLVLKQAARL
jgi:hypothetical protein